jgi:hypothetical protein
VGGQRHAPAASFSVAYHYAVRKHDDSQPRRTAQDNLHLYAFVFKLENSSPVKILSSLPSSHLFSQFAMTPLGLA